MPIDIGILAKYLLSSLAFSFFLFPIFIKILEYRQVLDAPDIRKVHLKHKPSMGGFPIVLGAAFSLLFFFNYKLGDHYNYLFAALLLIFIIGLRDDLIPMRAIYKLLSQLIPASIVFFMAETKLISLYDLSSLSFPEPLAWAITVFVIIVITNAFNLIDGIDGLAGTVSFLVLLFYSIWFYLIGEQNTTYILVSFIGAILSFLYYNWQPSKIFMGDTGALVLGFLLACVTIAFININYQLEAQESFKFSASISTAISVMIIPLLDTLRVFIIRVTQSKSPFEADKNHLHHLFLNKGYSHAQTVLILAGFNIFCICLAVSLKNLNDIYVLPIIISASIVFSLGSQKIKSKTQPKESRIK